jgi:hypothetical protein
MKIMCCHISLTPFISNLTSLCSYTTSCCLSPNVVQMHELWPLTGLCVAAESRPPVHWGSRKLHSAFPSQPLSKPRRTVLTIFLCWFCLFIFGSTVSKKKIRTSQNMLQHFVLVGECAGRRRKRDNSGPFSRSCRQCDILYCSGDELQMLNK